MPLYEYQCEACGRRFEVIRKFSDPELDVCSLCGKGPVQRQVSSPAIQFKGTGWYITDYSRKGKSSGETSPTPGSGDSKTTTAATDAGTGKTETSSKAETPTPATKPATTDT
jgi:putative FmdB family regulatory protein